MERIVLFIATNLAIVLVLSVAARLLGVDAWLTSQGHGLGGLLVSRAPGEIQLGRNHFTSVTGTEAR